MENAAAVSFRTIIHGPYRDHPSEEALERFLMQHSDEDELELVETHILACEACTTRLEALELNLQATKLAMQNYLAENATQPMRPPLHSKVGSWLSLPRLSFLAASLAACAVGFGLITVPRNVTLRAERGNDFTLASAWVPLTLHLNAEALPPGPVEIEVVDELGSTIWHGEASAMNSMIVVEVPRLMKSRSQYFVRVYSPSNSNNQSGGIASTLLREYSLQTKSLF